MKINAQVYICTAVSIEDRVMIAAGVIFTNDRYPRAFEDGVEGLAASGPTEDTLMTIVGHGTTIGAGAIIGPGLTIGAYAMIGMGAAVVADVPSHGLVYGNPARLHGYVCVCGRPVARANHGDAGAAPALHCRHCGRQYGLRADDEGLQLLPAS